MRTLNSSLIGMLVSLVLLPSIASGATEVSGSPTDLRQFLQSDVRVVTLRNVATETAYTDTAKISLVVVTEDRQLSAAIEENTKLREDLSRALIDAGIGAEEIRSSKYSASPQYGWFGKAPTSYEVVNTVVVSVASETNFLSVSSLADATEAVSFGNVSFEMSDEKSYEDVVRDKALKAVLSDAAYFEKELGLALRPVDFSYSPVGRTDYNPYIEEVIVTGSIRNQSYSSSPPVRAPTTFDEVEFTVSVEVDFEVVRQDVDE